MATVEVKEAAIVTPSDPTPSHVLQLSALDSQLFLRFTIEYLLIYRPHPSHDRTQTVNGVKAALAQALVPYYPLAGRVREATNGSNLEVVCHGQGAIFVEAVSSTSISDFERPPQHCNQWRNLLTLQMTDLLGGPPLVMQLTWLLEGAAAVAIGISHCICDGMGSADFLNLWAELARGGLIDDLHPKPVWDRQLLNPKGHWQHYNWVSHPEFISVPNLSRLTSPHQCQETSLVPTAICFDHQRLADLKKIAASEGVKSVLNMSRVSEFSCTSFEVLAAHVWRSWVKAMGFPAKQTVRLLFSINIRRRVTPHLPSGYYGNGFVLGCARTSAKELVKKGLGWGASLVKEAKESVGNEYVESVVEAVSDESRAVPDSVGVLILSQWSRLGLERVDYGAGKPVHIGPVCSGTYCLFLPVFEKGDAVKVMVAVPKCFLAKYELSIRNP